MRVCAILLSVLLSLLPLQSFGEAFQDACVVTAPSGATLRTAPDPKAAKVDRIPYLAEVSRFDWSDEQTTVEGITACWFNVTWQGKEGWVFGGLVCSTPEEMAQIKAAGDKVKRVMNRLVLTADNGKTLEFIDVPVNNKENLNFRLEAILPFWSMLKMAGSSRLTLYRFSVLMAPASLPPTTILTPTTVTIACRFSKLSMAWVSSNGPKSQPNGARKMSPGSHPPAFSSLVKSSSAVEQRL